MLDLDPGFRPIRRDSGYLPLEDLGLIGDGATAALVGLDGSIPWMCVPEFDSEPLFCGLLDHEKGGDFTLTPEDLREARQCYEPDTGVLMTELRSGTGLVRVTDALALRSGADLADDASSARAELVRSAEVLAGTVRIRMNLQPRGGAQARAAFSGLVVEAARHPGLRLHLRSNHPLSGLQATYDLRQGDRLQFVLSWDRFHRHHPLDADARLRETSAAWRRWMLQFHYDGPEPAMVRRSAITLKLCDHWANGSLVAAPTSSLPAPVGGVRNWDYRYTWIRDAAFAVFAMRRVGFVNEADAFLGWVLDAFERSRRPRIMYTVEGGPYPTNRMTVNSTDTATRRPYGGATAPRTNANMTSTARCWTAPISGSGRAGNSTLRCGLPSVSWLMQPARRGDNPIRASGKSAARAAFSPIRPRCARWRFREPPR